MGYDFTCALTPPVLTGTPVQNDLGEFWAMVGSCDVVATNPRPSSATPACLAPTRSSTASTRSPSQSRASQSVRTLTLRRATTAWPRYVSCLGSQLTGKLYDLTKEFVLRRTAEVLEKYLPPKSG